MTREVIAVLPDFMRVKHLHAKRLNDYIVFPDLWEVSRGIISPHPDS